jgi:hypothetical protein
MPNNRSIRNRLGQEIPIAANYDEEGSFFDVESTPMASAIGGFEFSHVNNPNVIAPRLRWLGSIGQARRSLACHADWASNCLADESFEAFYERRRVEYQIDTDLPFPSSVGGVLHQDGNVHINLRPPRPLDPVPPAEAPQPDRTNTSRESRRLNQEYGIVDRSDSHPGMRPAYELYPLTLDQDYRQTGKTQRLLNEMLQYKTKNQEFFAPTRERARAAFERFKLMLERANVSYTTENDQTLVLRGEDMTLGASLPWRSQIRFKAFSPDNVSTVRARGNVLIFIDDLNECLIQLFGANHMVSASWQADLNRRGGL